MVGPLRVTPGAEVLELAADLLCPPARGVRKQGEIGRRLARPIGWSMLSLATGDSWNRVPGVNIGGQAERVSERVSTAGVRRSIGRSF